MRIEIDKAVVMVKWVPFMKVTASAPAEDGNFEVVEITGRFTDDEIDGIEERAIAEAWDSRE